MTDIRPFRALRPTSEAAPAIAALPYDVQSIEEARSIVAENPRSFLAIDEPVVNFPPGTDAFELAVYLKAGELLRGLKKSGDMATDARPSFYLYELTMDGRMQTGLVACVAVDDYLNGVVKEHESTRVDKEMDRVNHVRGCEAQTGPIFLTYPFQQQLADLFAQAKAATPIFDFVASDGVRHRGFMVDPSMNDHLRELFANMPRVYIADGHHRVAAASEVAKARRTARGSEEPTEEADYFLAVLFADSELAILPYERVVRNLNGLSSEEFLAELESRFDVERICNPCSPKDPLTISGSSDAQQAANAEELIRPKEKGEFCTYLDDRWYRCRIRPEDTSNDPYEGLDVSILQARLFEPVLGIADPRRSPRIDFVGGIRGLAELERRCKADCTAAFALYPTSIEELMNVADAGLMMPPKSTWFEPKLRSGLFIHEI